MNKATPCPTIPKGTEVAEQLLSVVNNIGQGTKKRSRDEKEDTMWKKKSIFFTLPYWEVFVVLHNLNVMHVEKNVCESIINIMLDCKTMFIRSLPIEIRFTIYGHYNAAPSI